jgi:hypothetical protein
MTATTDIQSSKPPQDVTVVSTVLNIANCALQKHPIYTAVALGAITTCASIYYDTNAIISTLAGTIVAAHSFLSKDNKLNTPAITLGAIATQGACSFIGFPPILSAPAGITAGVVTSIKKPVEKHVKIPDQETTAEVPEEKPVDTLAGIQNQSHVIDEELEPVEKMNEETTNREKARLEIHLTKWSSAVMLANMFSSKEVDDDTLLLIAKEASIPDADLYNIFTKHVTGLNFVQKIFCYLLIGMFSWIPKLFISKIADNVINGIRDDVKSESSDRFLEIFDKQVNKTSEFLEEYNATLDHYRDDAITKETRENYLKEQLSNPEKEKKLYKHFAAKAVDDYIPDVSFSELLLNDIFMSSWEPRSLLGRIVKYPLMATLLPFRYVAAGISAITIDLALNFIKNIYAKSIINRKIPIILGSSIENVKSDEFKLAFNEMLCKQLRELIVIIRKDEVKPEAQNHLYEHMFGDLKTLVSQLLKVSYKEVECKDKDALKKLQKDGPEGKNPKEKTIRNWAQRFNIDIDEEVQKILENIILKKACINTLNYFMEHRDEIETLLTSTLKSTNNLFDDAGPKTEEQKLAIKAKLELSIREVKSLKKQLVDTSIDVAIEAEYDTSPTRTKGTLTTFYTTLKQRSEKHYPILAEDIEQLDKAKNDSDLSLEYLPISMRNFQDWLTTTHNTIAQAFDTASPSVKKDIDEQIIPLRKAQINATNTLSLLRKHHAYRKRLVKIGEKLNLLQIQISKLEKLSSDALDPIDKLLCEIEDLDTENHFITPLQEQLQALIETKIQIERKEKDQSLLINLNNDKSHLLEKLKSAQDNYIQHPTSPYEIKVKAIEDKMIALIDKQSSSRTRSELKEALKRVKQSTTPLQAQNAIDDLEKAISTASQRAILEKRQIEITIPNLYRDYSRKIMLAKQSRSSNQENIEETIATKMTYLSRQYESAKTACQSFEAKEHEINFFQEMTNKHGKPIIKDIGSPIILRYVDGFLDLMTNQLVYRGLSHSAMRTFVTT